MATFHNARSRYGGATGQRIFAANQARARAALAEHPHAAYAPIANPRPDARPLRKYDPAVVIPFSATGTAVWLFARQEARDAFVKDFGAARLQAPVPLAGVLYDYVGA